MSQLDRIAQQNLRTPAHGLGASGTLLALLGGLVLLGAASMWRGGVSDEARSAAVAEGPPAQAAVTQAAPAPVVTVAAPPSTLVAPDTASSVQVTPAEPATAAVAAAEDAARRARARQLADARRKAAQLAQERAAAEEAQRLQVAQQREAERIQAQAQLAEQARQRAAAEQARSQTIQVALNTRRGVGDACSAAGGPISRHFCSARECGKAEHQGDPVCVNLREDELARQRASIER